ncbi:unnamed protein product [Protopolystoma xenopodis]|uniref:Fibronectin type-III domain-containing protein n=1 Tax=Protopolystoma xenopodis TaxID=117903 RepID=A0A448XKS1_9PLAT|nr:unnamed protein product [Protopolystoma xenopodis]
MTSRPFPSAPLGLLLISYSFDRITVAWDPPLLHNGILKNYVVSAKEVINRNQVPLILVESTHLEATIENLKPKVLYSVEVAAVTEPSKEGKGGGQGPFSNMIQQLLPPARKSQRQNSLSLVPNLQARLLRKASFLFKSSAQFLYHFCSDASTNSGLNWVHSTIREYAGQNPFRNVINVIHPQHQRTSGPPTNLILTDRTSTEIAIQWSEPSVVSTLLTLIF